MKKLLSKLTDATGYTVVKKSDVLAAMEFGRDSMDLAFMKAMARDDLPRLFDAFGDSKSQLRQDLFVLSQLNFKQGGFFVEFGATDGVTLSNTWLLENKFGWRGILAEPATTWHERLKANRRCAIDTDCVWARSGETLEFLETDWAELSTISDLANSDGHAKTREKNTKSYTVETVSLNDLLARHSAPDHIDYLSIDTEGSEFDILSALDFGRYSFSVITCEHNHTPRRQEIFELLTGAGYRRVLEDVSQFDDWYVR